MHKTLNLVISSLFSVFLLSADTIADSSSQSDPLACSREGEITDAEPGVVKSQGLFTRPGGLQYDFVTYSIYAKPQNDSDKMCIRYEVHNLSSEEIEQFRWPDAEQWWIDILPNERTKHRRRLLTRYEIAQVSRSKVSAFENSGEVTKAYFTIEQVEAEQVGDDSLTKLGYFNPGNSLPSVVPFLSRSKLRNMSLVAYEHPDRKLEYPPLDTTFELSDIAVSASSTARFTGSAFETNTQINISNTAAKLYAPTLPTLKITYKPPLDESDIINFSQTLPEFRNSVRPLQGGTYTVSMSYEASVNSTLPVLFIVPHPITVETTNRTFCIGILSYSPIPIAPGPEYCKTEG